MTYSTKEKIYIGVGVLVILGLLLGAKMCVANAMYGDWTCAYSKCVRVK